MATVDKFGATTQVAGFFGFLDAIVMVAVSTVAGLLIAPRWGSASIELLFLPAVLAAAVWRGLGPALMAAMASALSYNYFFTEPYSTFLIDSLPDMVTVVVLFLVATVTSHLAASMREQAKLAKAHAGRNATIAGLARQLLSSSGEREIAQVAVQGLSRLFQCHAVFITERGGPVVVAAEPADTTVNSADHAAASLTFCTGLPAGRGIGRAGLADWQFHPVASGHPPHAAIGLARDDGMPPVDDQHAELLGSLLDQIALALVRERLEEEARQFAATRERDRMRSALLASIGQDVKPRITAINSAIRSLRRAGSNDNGSLLTMANEISKLDYYIENLSYLSPDSDREPIEIGDVTIDLYRRIVCKDGAQIRLTPKEYAVLAELGKNAGRVLTHAYLLRAVWGRAHEGQIEYLRVAVRALRQKLERDARRPELIINEPAVGYRLAAGY